ncbi:hypothetical protein GCM10020255_075490 [Rhodococcus baikonurensis]
MLPDAENPQARQIVICLAGAAIQANAIGGTKEACVTRSDSIRPKAVDGMVSGARTTVPPAWNTPRMPGELIGKLCAAGRTTNMRVESSTPQIGFDARTE